MPKQPGRFANPGLPLLRNMLAKHGLIDGKNVLPPPRDANPKE
jgi:hypothetical protein